MHRLSDPALARIADHRHPQAGAKRPGQVFATAAQFSREVADIDGTGQERFDAGPGPLDKVLGWGPGGGGQDSGQHIPQPNGRPPGLGDHPRNGLPQVGFGPGVVPTQVDEAGDHDRRPWGESEMGVGVGTPTFQVIAHVLAGRGDPSRPRANCQVLATDHRPRGIGIEMDLPQIVQPPTGDAWPLGTKGDGNRFGWTVRHQKDWGHITN